MMAVGGSEDTEKDAVILKEFVRLAGGAKARLVVMTVATDHPEEVGKEYAQAFKALGIDQVEAVDVSQREDAQSEQGIKKVHEATGIYFTGGDQLHITALLGGSKMHQELFTRFTKGVVIGGTSAGASMMGNSMILKGEPSISPRFGAVEIGPGMDFVVGAIIDVHFSERARLGRLITAVAHCPQDIGIGIDENTAFVVNDSRFEVIGEGSVTVVDAGGISFTNLPEIEKDENLALFGVQIHVLPSGHKYDFETRSPVAAKSENHKNGSNNESGRKAKNGSGKEKPGRQKAGAKGKS